MAISKEYLKTEIGKCKAAINTIEEGLWLNQTLLKAFQKEYASIRNSKGNKATS